MSRVLSFAIAGLIALLSFGFAKADTPRWYTEAQIEKGEKLFQINCAGCHGEQAQGQVADWRRRLPDGSMPAPPLNGSAHAWHHPRRDLLWLISEGSMMRGGKMPAFRSGLAREEQLAVIAYFQDFWPEETYQVWLKRGGLKN